MNLRVNIDDVENSTKEITQTITTELVAVTDGIKGVINNLDSSWKDTANNSSIKYKEATEHLVSSINSNIEVINKLISEINKAMTEYSNNEAEGSANISSVEI